MCNRLLLAWRVTARWSEQLHLTKPQVQGWRLLMWKLKRRKILNNHPLDKLTVLLHDISQRFKWKENVFNCMQTICSQFIWRIHLSFLSSHVLWFIIVRVLAKNNRQQFIFVVCIFSIFLLYYWRSIIKTNNHFVWLAVSWEFSTVFAS